MPAPILGIPSRQADIAAAFDLSRSSCEGNASMGVEGGASAVEFIQIEVASVQGLLDVFAAILGTVRTNADGRIVMK